MDIPWWCWADSAYIAGPAVCRQPCCPTGRVADQRKFVIMYAVPGKSIEGGPGSIEVNLDDIRGAVLRHHAGRPRTIRMGTIHYRSRSTGTRSRMGNVVVNGDVFGEAEIPWPIAPDSEIVSWDEEGALPWTELDQSGGFLAVHGRGSEPAGTKRSILTTTVIRRGRRRRGMTSGTTRRRPG